MAKRILTGIDIGTYQTKVVVAEQDTKDSHLPPRIIGLGKAETKGLRHGYVVNIKDTARAVRKALNIAEKGCQSKIKKAYLSVGGIGLNAITSTGIVTISKANLEIDEGDVERAMEIAQTNILKEVLQNRKILHTIPLSYKVDNLPVLGRPHGMKGVKLEVTTLFITTLEHHINDMIQAVEEAGVDVIDVVASPLAAAVITLNKTQKIAGCVLANIGSETVSMVVYEDNLPVSLEVMPIGSNDITNDIALGLRVPLEEAEQIKLGTVMGSVNFSKKKLDEIVAARLSDMFDLIEAHLKKIGKNGMLPAGIIITGGGSGITTIEDLARAYLKLPSKIANFSKSGEKVEMKDSTWAVAYGLCVIGLSDGGAEALNGNGEINFIKSAGSGFIKWLKQFMP